MTPHTTKQHFGDPHIKQNPILETPPRTTTFSVLIPSYKIWSKMAKILTPIQKWSKGVFNNNVSGGDQVLRFLTQLLGWRTIFDTWFREGGRKLIKLPKTTKNTIQMHNRVF